MLLLLLIATVATPAAGGSRLGLVAPDTSMDTIPVAYFGGKGGKSGPRSGKNIAMLAKMRLVILEKWEGPCWDECIANSTMKPTPLPCSSESDVEAGSLALLKELRSLNPKLSTMLYMNVLLLFPFYSLAAKYLQDAENTLLMDAVSGGP